jgi:putative hydrolase of the HAD superfamily
VEKGKGVIRGVVFDFGNVICSFEYDRFLERLRGWSGLPVETLREKVFGSGAHRRFERGEIDTAGFHRLVESAIGAEVPPEAFAEAFMDIFTPVEGTHSIIRALKARYRLGLLSNTNELHFQRCIRPVPVFPLFDTVTLSYEVGALKPEAAIYRDALRKLSLPPEECVFIDDIPEYAEGARAVGMRGIRFESPERLRDELGELGVDAS